MSADPLSCASPAVGVFMDDSPVPFGQGPREGGISFIQAATNLSINERRYQTRSLWKEYALESAPDEWLTANTQGIIAYDPRIGRNAFNTTSGNPGMIESAAGKLYRITPQGNTFIVEDISSGFTGRPSMRLAWMAQGANYVIRTDEASPTQIFDGVLTTTSTGYNKNAPASSRLPNFAGPVAYSDRFWLVVNGNEVIAGDHLHRIEPVDNSDLLKTTDQSYDFTSTSFSSPDELGNITSLNLVTSARGGDLAAQGELIVGTQGPAMWGILTGTQRTLWNTKPMRRVLHRALAPVGPFAAWTSSNELVFRTIEGITSIKYADAETSAVGNPYVNLGNEIKPLLDRDPTDLLIYASMTVNSRRQRLALTVWPVVENADRWHRAYVTAALSPGRTRVPEAMVWEGVSTLPEAMGEIIQFVEVRGYGSIRTFALLRKADGTKGLAEWTNLWGDDLLADGTAVPIKWQMLTRKLCPAGEYSPANWGEVFLLLTKLRYQATVNISARANTRDAFKLIHSGTYTNPDWGTTGGYANPDPIKLGSILRDFKGQPWLEILVQGTGCCTIDLAIASSGGGKPSGPPDPPNKCIPPETLCVFDPFAR